MHTALKLAFLYSRMKRVGVLLLPTGVMSAWRHDNWHVMSLSNARVKFAGSLNFGDRISLKICFDFHRVSWFLLRIFPQQLSPALLSLDAALCTTTTSSSSMFSSLFGLPDLSLASSSALCLEKPTRYDADENSPAHLLPVPGLLGLVSE